MRWSALKLNTTTTTDRGATFVELILKVVELMSMIGWFFILKNRLAWPFMGKALLAIGLGWLTTWILALGMSWLREKRTHRQIKADKE